MQVESCLPCHHPGASELTLFREPSYLQRYSAVAMSEHKQMAVVFGTGIEIQRSSQGQHTLETLKRVRIYHKALAIIILEDLHNNRSIFTQPLQMRKSSILTNLDDRTWGNSAS